MDNIRRNTDPLKGPPDGVAADVQCVVTSFDTPKKGGSKKVIERTVKGQATIPCTVFTAYSEGTVGFSVRDMDMMITIRLDELMAIMQEAAAANVALQESMPGEYKDAELETRWRELQGVQWDEADSPSGIVLAAPFWKFPAGVDRDELWAWFGEQHSLGLEYLHELID